MRPLTACPFVRSLTMLAALCFALIKTASAQEHSFHHYDTRDGLPGLVVHGIAQDQDGFLWFSTETGLSRFDGKNFRNYTRNDGLPSNEVFYTLIDSRNRVWISSFKSAICYYYKGRVYNQQNDSLLRRLTVTCPVNRIFETRQGELLFQMSDRSHYLLPTDPRKKITLLPHDSAFSPSLLERVRLRQGNVLYPLFSRDALLRKFSLDSFGYCGFSGKAGAPGSCYVFTRENTVLLLFPDEGRFLRIVDRDIMLCKLIPDGHLAFISRRSGVRIYDPATGRFIAAYLQQYKVHDVFKDREGSLWFSTNGSGIYRLNNPAFRDYTFGSRQQQAAVHHIARYKGRLQVIIDGAACRELVPAATDGPDSLYAIKRSRFGIDKIMADSGRSIHISNGALDSILSSWQRMPHSVVKTLYYENDTLYTANGNQAVNIKVSTRQILDTPLNIRTTCAFKWKGVEYIGTLDGLYTYRNGRLHYEGRDRPFFRNRISAIAVSGDGTLWIGTYEEGVAGLRPDGRLIKVNERNGGLSSNICRCLYARGAYLWIGTEKGINKVDIANPAYPVIARYTTADGLQSDIINALYTEGYMVYAGTQTGLTVFDERSVPLTGSCDIVLTGIGIRGTTRYDSLESPLELRHADNSIRFEFAGISFLSAGNISYRYRLLGLDDRWLSTGESGVSFPSLPSGHYTFEVKAINKFGKESKALRKDFRILPSFWERKEIQAAGVVLLLLLCLFLFQLRIKYLRRKDREQQEIRKKLMDLEQMALRAQMNPHFIFNCLNSIQHFVLNGEGRSANFYISRFAGLVRSTLENASRTYISLREELSYLKSYIELERMQLSPAFRYTIDIAGDIDIHHTQVPNMVIQPLLENAIKHGVHDLGAEGLIELRFRKEEHQEGVTCIVTDNGPGIWRAGDAKPREHRSKGIAITDERIRILNELSDSELQITLKREWAYSNMDRSYGTKILLFFPDKM